MTNFVWFEDRYTNMAVQRGRLDAGAESAYGVRCLRPSLWAEATMDGQESHAELPAFSLNRRFRIASMDADWSGAVRLTVHAPTSYHYSFRGRAVEPSMPPVAYAAAQPFYQRVEVDGEFSVRLVTIAAGGSAITIPGSVSSHSIRRSGARQGRWEAPRRSGQSRWEACWNEKGANDLYTINHDTVVTPEPRLFVRDLVLPLDAPEAAFGVELALNGLIIWVKQSGFSGVVRGGFETTDGGFQVELEPLP